MQRIVVVSLVLAALTGCGMSHTTCLATTSLLGATAGGVTGGVLSKNSDTDFSNGAIAGITAGSAIGGGLVGLGLGALVCPEEEVAEVPPPPPPPPYVPPPARRGG